MCIRFRDYLKKYGLRFAVALACGILSCVLLALGPQLLGDITTHIFSGILAKLNGTGAMNLEAIAEILRLLTGVYFISVLLLTISGWILEGISADLTCRLQENALEKLHTLPLSYFETKSVGELQDCVVSDTEVLGRCAGHGTFSVVTGVSSMIGIVIMMVRISVLLAAAVGILLAVSAVLMYLASGKFQMNAKRQQEADAAANGYVEEMYSGRSLLRIFGREEAAAETYAVYNERQREAAWKADFGAGLMAVAMQAGSVAGYVVTVLLGGICALRGDLAVGDIQAFVHYIRNTERPVNQVAEAFREVRRARVAWGRLRELLGAEAEPEGAEERKPAVCTTDAAGGEVRFEHVTFSYGDKKPVLEDFSAVIAPGTYTAITGCTGAGKTTIVKLLLRFYDVQSGAIYIDGKDIREYDRRALRAKFGMVLQEVWLFHGSILENIRYGKQEASEEEVRLAAKRAGADDFIRFLPQGYETVVGEDGYQLSDGQKQLLTIARAILGKPEILILDEATSSVDTRTEQKIHGALTALMQGRTCFVIAHRPGTIREAQQVIHIGKNGG